MWLFNPSCELAVQRGSLSYTPPPLLAQLERDLRFLPLLLARSGEGVFLGRDNPNALPRRTDPFCLTTPERPAAASATQDTPRPWGWTRAVCHQLGLEEAARQWPTSTLRDLFSRRLSVALEERLKDNHPPAFFDFSAAPALVASMDELRRYMASCGPRIVLKSLWSASGRGVRFYDLDGSRPGDPEECRRHAERTLRADGALIAERRLERRAELSLMFEWQPPLVRPLYHSLYESAPMGAFGRELCGAPPPTSHLPDGWTHLTAERLAQALEQVLPRQLQPFIPTPLTIGVDAMLTSPDTLRPSVELNVRHTMGELSHAVEGLLSPHSRAAWSIRRFDAPGQARLFCEQQAGLHPLRRDANGGLESGFFTLAPIDNDALFAALGWAEEKGDTQ